MHHKLAIFRTKEEAQSLSDALFQATQAAFFVQKTKKGFSVVFDDLNGFYGGLELKQQFVKGWVAALKTKGNRAANSNNIPPSTYCTQCEILFSTSTPATILLSPNTYLCDQCHKENQPVA